MLSPRSRRPTLPMALSFIGKCHCPRRWAIHFGKFLKFLPKPLEAEIDAKPGLVLEFIHQRQRHFYLRRTGFNGVAIAGRPVMSSLKVPMVSRYSGFAIWFFHSCGSSLAS